MTGLASRAQLRMSFLRYALVTVPAAVLLGSLSARLAGTAPAWFGLVQASLAILLGLVLAMLFHARGARYRGLAIASFLAQLLAFGLWPPLLFGLGEARWGLLLVALMIALTVIMIVLLWWIRRPAALLMGAYLAWLCYAALLTASVEVAPQPAGTDIVL